MNPRYQVFISSTFRDLKPERQAVLEAVLEIGHFPAGMEIFPAANSTPWSLIEAIIKESDYYVLIIGGMYGSTDESGVSYTEKEYDLAQASGLPILGFLHKNPSAIPFGLSEISQESRDRLGAFREKVESHHCKYWGGPDELKAQVVIALTHAMRVTPRVGWVRTDKSESPDTLKKLTLAMEANVHLQSQIKELRDAIGRRTPGGEGLASGDDPLVLHFQKPDKTIGELQTTWDSIFLVIAPDLMTERGEWVCRANLDRMVATWLKQTQQTIPGEAKQSRIRVTDQDLHRIIYQFIALEYIEPVTITSQQTVFGMAQTGREQGYKLTKLGAHSFARRQAMRKSPKFSPNAGDSAGATALESVAGDH